MTQAVRSDDITNVHRCTVKPAVGGTVGIVSQLCVSITSRSSSSRQLVSRGRIKGREFRRRCTTR